MLWDVNRTAIRPPELGREGPHMMNIIIVLSIEKNTERIQKETQTEGSRERYK